MSPLSAFIARALKRLNHSSQQIVAAVMPPTVDETLLELTYSRMRYREGSSLIVNGLVNIAHSRDGGQASWHWGTAHTHSYGTSVIGNELRSILKDPAGMHNVELKLEYGPEPSLFDEKSVPSRIVFQYVAGPEVGRAFWFEPVPGDEDGWNEMVTYARQLIVNNAVERICRQKTA